MDEIIQGSIPFQESPVEGIIQGRQGIQDLKGEPPDRPVEGIVQGRQDRQDLKGEPPDSCVEEFI